MKGLDAHLTAGPPEAADPTHWHVSRHASDDDVYISPDIWDALDYAATTLRERAEFEYEGISASGDAGDYESAYDAFKESNRLDSIYQNAKHIGEQHKLPDVDGDDTSAFHAPGTVRAPLYRGYGGDAKIMERAVRVIQEINSETEIGISECSDELIYLTDAGEVTDQDNGQPFHADEYDPPVRFTRGAEPPANTDR